MSEDSNIQTYLRVRPSKQPSGYVTVDEMEKNSLKFNLPPNFKSDYINNTKKAFGFNFSGVLDMGVSQDDVFKKVGVAAVQNAVDGYNSTIFACKQPPYTFV